jgi:hypothetical protein
VLLIRWAGAFALTQVIETPIWTYSLRERFPRTGPRILAALGASTITHPIVWFVIPHIIAHPYLTYLIVAESFAVIAEAIYMHLLGLRWALFWSVVANGTSFYIGVLCQRWFHFP